MAKYSDRSFEVRIEINQVGTQTKVQIFSVWNQQLIKKNITVQQP